MLERLFTLYQELEVIDLNLLLQLELGETSDLELHLQKREKHLHLIGFCFEQVMTEKQFSETSYKKLVELQNLAQERSRQIISVMNGLFDGVKRDIVQYRSKQASSGNLGTYVKGKSSVSGFIA